MNNLELYDKVRSVPQSAKKTISGGRLNGKTDINPMWRIKTLTEQFGPCGVGWKYEIADKRLERCEETKEVAAFVDINLYIKNGDKWSEPIPGTGGSAFVAKEKNGLYMSDECFKMALTDAISVACKALGIGADVYWEADKTKYDRPTETPVQPNSAPQTEQKPVVTEKSMRVAQIEHLIKGTAYTMTSVNEWIFKRYGKAVPIDNLSEANYNDVYNALSAAVQKGKGNGSS